jgi:hypothetical protein
MENRRRFWLACDQCLQVFGLIVRSAIFPAAKQNSLEGQRPDGCVMAFVLIASLAVLPHPSGKGKRMGGPFVKRLA